jgi:hypothetical protein
MPGSLPAMTMPLVAIAVLAVHGQRDFEHLQTK